MREINECTAEVFRRSEKRIAERKKFRKRILALSMPLCLIITICLVTLLPDTTPTDKDNLYDAGQNAADTNSTSEHIAADGAYNADCGLEGDYMGSIDSFSFSLTWGCYGISSYDSKSGKLVKSTDATNPEEYITTYQLTDEQKQIIYDLIKTLDIKNYPDVYNPHTNGLASNPSMTLILSVNTDTLQKTVTAEDIALTYEAENAKGQRFLSVCKAIQDVLTQTKEWEALPEYEFFYD